MVQTAEFTHEHPYAHDEESVDADETHDEVGEGCLSSGADKLRGRAAPLLVEDLVQAVEDGAEQDDEVPE